MSTWTFDELFRIWQNPAPQTSPFPWPHEGIAIEGDFAGIQGFVLKPVPGAKGAAKRLRGRSLLVVAYTELIARKVEAVFAGSARLYTAGGRFLISAAPDPDWALKLRALQSELDAWTLEQFNGEVVFHLAAWTFQDGLIPRGELRAAMQLRRENPLGEALLDNGKWRSERFYKRAGSDPFQCPSCRATADIGYEQPDEEDLQKQRICAACDRDKRIGGRLAGITACRLTRSTEGIISFGRQRYGLSEEGEYPLEVVHHMPRNGPEPMSLQEIATHARGREWLGFLRIDADRVGRAFEDTKQHPQRVAALSRILNQFFCREVQRVISEEYPLVYPVYGGGDDLFVIGPWDKTLELAVRLESEFRQKTKKKLDFSAGLALAKPKQHILAKSDEAAEALEHAKEKGRARLHALGETFAWPEARQALKEAVSVSAWHDHGSIPSAFLQDVLELHAVWKKERGVRHRPLLHYQIERNLGKQGEAGDWARKLLADEGAWSRAGFAARYAVLASERETREDRK